MRTLTKILALGALVLMGQNCSQVGFNTSPQEKSANCTTSNCFNWIESGFGICSLACGGGTQTQTVTCEDGTGKVVNNSNCTGPMPPTTQACNSQACTAPYNWLIGPFGPCSVTCGGGTQTRTVTCQENNGTTVANSFCNTALMPPTSQACNTQACPGVTKSKTFTIPKPQVDVVFIVDDSMTNAPQISNLTQNLPAFFNTIESQQIDWQACYITTDVTYANAPAGQDGSLVASNGQTYAGQPLPWVTGAPGSFAPIASANSYVINSQTPNLSSILTSTASYIQSPAIYPGQGNAQGIGALYMMVNRWQNTGCFRPGATLATILLSDKDENATYGNCNQLKALGLTANPNENFCEPPILTPTATWPYSEDPATAKNYISAALGTTLIFNSIIVLPGDVTCQKLETQNEQGNIACPAGSSTCVSPAFPGAEYNALSTLTGGSVTSICQNGGYSSNLNGINQKIVQTVQDITLDCTPMPGTTPMITYNPNFATTPSFNGPVISFNPALPGGTQVTVTYTCK